MVAIDPASSPPPTDVISVRFQSASLIFWHSVRSPTDLSEEASAAIRNGASSDALNANPDTARRGRLIQGTASACRR
ncbi:MAG TPA: hypothetical protein VHR17_17385 [Thermoanaerobaculia bacterium]|nr:hypothetical protein [Thermoanaerobaculia bacterium]